MADVSGVLDLLEVAVRFFYHMFHTLTLGRFAKKEKKRTYKISCVVLLVLIGMGVLLYSLLEFGVYGSV